LLPCSIHEDAMRLSEHFYLREFTRSQTAERIGRSIVAPPAVVAELRRLCKHVLQPLRYRLGRPIAITSGYRPRWLNTAIGGALGSEHQFGRAADLIVPGMTAFQASDAIARHGQDLPLAQIILEFQRWTHVAIAPAGLEPRRQALTAYHDGDRVAYTPGIHLIRTERTT
jgi:zinc D-Ala-D-Ala carboxypeptidase